MRESRLVKVSFLAGTITSITVILLVTLFIGFRIGFSSLGATLRSAIIPNNIQSRALDLPESIRQELIELDAVVDNAGNPTQRGEHDTILVQPNEKLGYVLRSGANISGFVLKAQNPLNLDPLRSTSTLYEIGCKDVECVGGLSPRPHSS
jgi:hypothetical protein